MWHVLPPKFKHCAVCIQASSCKPDSDAEPDMAAQGEAYAELFTEMMAPRMWFLGPKREFVSIGMSSDAMHAICCWRIHVKMQQSSLASTMCASNLTQSTVTSLCYAFCIRECAMQSFLHGIVAGLHLLQECHWLKQCFAVLRAPKQPFYLCRLRSRL